MDIFFRGDFGQSKKKKKSCFKIHLDFYHIMQCLHNIGGYYIELPHFNIILLYVILLYLIAWAPIFIEIQIYFPRWIFEQNA